MSDAMFTRRHYKRIASVIWHILQENPNNEHYGKPVISRNLLVDDLCVMFRRDNPLFDEEKFKNAVDGPENPDG